MFLKSEIKILQRNKVIKLKYQKVYCLQKPCYKCPIITQIDFYNSSSLSYKQELLSSLLLAYQSTGFFVATNFGAPLPGTSFISGIRSNTPEGKVGSDAPSTFFEGEDLS